MKFNKNVLRIEPSDWELMDDDKNAYKEIRRVAVSKGMDLDKWVDEFGEGCRVRIDGEDWLI